ncbi:MAG: ABC transporter ATP-binding protein [Nitrososphaerota archaeon]|jgi:ABC-2 type transport system ATP-binding protein|nr:ABC transporter ATP-binding protein [Nitrososphaerota archaeon]MDG6952873.1 ABC transporter ATP-binding protein [Nitrososphaerota archaeon]MDG6956567.1 ABC transporter ATP-binding protein [Nitrososphaerota archaeon]MDG6958504.1 ABC transporter ATP-binding protein [Nitrososphaerota archaeon]MDG6960171.1 ABC transporter ATP-binding protein [Nitrososphaerota archaeon]
MASSGRPGACIELTHVSKSYGKVPALNDLSFDIPVGGRYSLLGPNGAGKSTTLKLLIGSLRPDTGNIRILGSSPDSRDSKAVVGYLPEDALPYRMLSVRENLEYIGALRGVPDVKGRTDFFLDELDLRQYEKANVGRLSRGNTQKLAIALALIHSPKVLLLDEPLNYLDIPTQEKVIGLLDRLEGTHLVSTHIMSIANRLTDSVIMISKGMFLWEGTIEELRNRGSPEEPIEKVVARMMTGAS